MFDVIDAKILRAAERAAKIFAVLTGKDNFSFARATLAAILGWFAIYSAKILILGTRKEAILCLSIALSFGILSISVWRNIAKDESAREREQREGIKSFGLDTSLRWIRMSELTMFIAFCTVLPFIYVFPLLRIWALLVMPYHAGCLWVYYLMSIDRPPCAKSKVLDFLGSLAGKVKGMLAPMPVPVAVPVSTASSL